VEIELRLETGGPAADMTRIESSAQPPATHAARVPAV
jgi:hypothetical protein